ncbi:MAG: SusC/RagA family TonB-linked outer membrane protein, partial [Bacteroidales bacterium]
NYSLSLSGGVKGVSYYAALSFNDTRGIIQNSGFKRYTGRLNLDYQLFKWLKIGYKYYYTNRDQDVNLADIGGTLWYRSAIYLNPLLSATSDFNDLWYSGQKYNSPRVYIDMCKNNDVRTSYNNTLYFELEPVKGLKIRTQESLYSYQRNSYQYQPGTLPAKAADEGGYAYRAEYNEQSLLSENTVSYVNNFKSGHNLDALVGFTAQNWKTNNMTLSGRGYFLDDNMWNNMGAIPDKNNYSASTSRTEKLKMSFLARFNYNYNQRYYVTLTGRYDGASNFAANHKWGFFPSGALKWNIANEGFLKENNTVNDLSLRLSAGRTGNDGIGAYRSLAALGSSTGGYLFGGTQPVAYYPSRLASDNLTWEKTDLYNIATDVSLFKNRLNITFEGYLSYTKDLLLNVQTPTHTGYSSKFANVGKTNNKGIELSIESQNIVTPDFGWSTMFTLSHNRQKVTDIGTSDFVSAYAAYGNNSYMMYGYVKDYPLNALWGFKYGGTWKNKEEIERNEVTKAYISTSNTQKSPGCARFMDVNHDGIMNEKDLVYMGSADPKIYGGLQNTFRYKNLSFSFYFNYSLGGKIYNISEQWLGGSYMTNQYRYMLDGWHPVRNPNSDIPRAGSAECIPSDRLIYDASFLRLKNVSLSYNFDLRRQTKNVIKDLTVSASGENLYLWKKYNGFDPDVSSESSNATLRRVDIGAYPKARTIIFSVQVKY